MVMMPSTAKIMRHEATSLPPPRRPSLRMPDASSPPKAPPMGAMTM